MRIVGLTGGIACGKTTVARWLQEAGAAVIDADAISRELTAPGGEALPALLQAFGPEVFHPDGSLDRVKLGEMVFGQEVERQRLNGILHPLVQQRMREKIENCRKSGNRIVVLDVPLLYEAGMEGMADFVVCVSAPQELQIQRLRERNGYSREEALARIHSQWPLEEKELRADVVIRTDRPIEEVQASTLVLYQCLAKGDPHDPIATEIPKRGR